MKTAAPTTTCQICGRAIMAKTGKIAHHGYKRPDSGWQTASCSGARHLPYEVSCDALPGAIKAVEKFIETQTTKMNDFIANPPATLDYTRGTWTKETKKVERPDGFTADDRYSSRPGSYASLFSSRKYEFEKMIEAAGRDLVFLKARLAAWKPAAVETEFAVIPLDEVKAGEAIPPRNETPAETVEVPATTAVTVDGLEWQEVARLRQLVNQAESAWANYLSTDSTGGYEDKPLNEILAYVESILKRRQLATC